MDVIDECKPSLAVMKELIASLTFNGEAALACCTKAFIAATDVVEWLVAHDLLRQTEERLYLTPHARLISNQVFTRFMEDAE